MRDCLILGSGRSGTSLVASMAHQAGYFLGEPLLPPNVGNPRGRFESREVNAINEALLAPAMPPRRPGSLWDNLFLRHVPLPDQRWLAALPVEREIVGTPELTARMQRLVGQQPFCFKDPRFSYTLPAWRPALGAAIFICVFRHPSETVASMLREHRNTPRLRSLAMSYKRALQVWTLMYRHILEKHSHSGQWFFVHYQQVLTGEAVDGLGEFLDATLDRNVADPALHRSRPIRPIPAQVQEIYSQLCALAGFSAT